MPDAAQRNSRIGRFVLIGIAMWLFCSSSGCTRILYRLRADKEVKYLVSQKSNDPRWQYDDFTIGMDPRSRFFDPTDADWPAMPYDDPAAHRYMHCLAGKKDYPCWHAGGDWYALENPQWKRLLAQYNEMTEEGALKLTMNGSVCLAQMHSSDFRTQIETIYLSALDVSTTRFSFDVQFFGNSNTVFDHTKDPATGESNTLRQDTNFFIDKTFSTGGELMVGVANSIVWQFAGPDTNNNVSLLNFNFVQPLLRGGGRVVALETLRIVERVLLYNLRAFQRYRQGFYVNVTVGAGGLANVQGPQRRGGFLGNTGLTGFTGTGAGGIGGVAAGTFGIQTGGGTGAGGQGQGLGLAGGGAGAVGGFLGLMQNLYQTRVIEANLNSLLRTLGLLEANLDAGLMDIVQVDNFRQNIETQRASLLSAQVNYQTLVDQFKLGIIGLPPDIAVDVDDGLLRQFEFVDPKTIKVQYMIDDFVRIVGKLPQEPTLADLTRGLEVLGELQKRMAGQFESGRKDLERLETVAPQRKGAMSTAEAARFDQDRVRLAESMTDVQNRFSQTTADLEQLTQKVAAMAQDEAADEIVSLATRFSGLVQELVLVKARARIEAVTITPIELTSAKALDIARANRLDWMNNRAQLVDAWRLIAFQANSLRAGLDLTFAGNMGTVGNNPVAFTGNDGNLRVGVRFDSPFTRRVERNNYRSVMIQYQQTRRQLYLFQDTVNLTLRVLIRTLKQLEVNLEIQRRAMTIAIRRVDKTREDLNKPPAPVQPGQQVIPLGPTVAQDLILALNDLQQVQNNLISVVMNHIENRLLLYRELGILELDDCGIWIDRPINEAEWLTEAECPIPPSVPIEWMEDAEVSEEDVERFESEHAEESIDDRFKSLVSATHGALRGARVKELTSSQVPQSRVKPAGGIFGARKPATTAPNLPESREAAVATAAARMTSEPQAEFLLPPVEGAATAAKPVKPAEDNAAFRR